MTSINAYGYPSLPECIAPCVTISSRRARTSAILQKTSMTVFKSSIQCRLSKFMVITDGTPFMCRARQECCILQAVAFPVHGEARSPFSWSPKHRGISYEYLHIRGPWYADSHPSRKKTYKVLTIEPVFSLLRAEDESYIAFADLQDTS